MARPRKGPPTTTRRCPTLRLGDLGGNGSEGGRRPAARPDSPRGDEDAWTVVVKEEPVSQATLDLPTQVLPVEMEPANIAVPTQVEAPKPAEDEFFDDMD